MTAMEEDEKSARECGTCNVCCTAMNVRALDKPAGVRCEHQTDNGCGNYANRPDVCRAWYCMWVRDTAGIFTEAHRPDRLGVFFTASTPGPNERQTIRAHPLFEGAAGRREASNVILFLSQFAPIELLPAPPKDSETPATLTHNGRAVA